MTDTVKRFTDSFEKNVLGNMPDLTPPVLQPIEDAPEGEMLALYRENKTLIFTSGSLKQDGRFYNSGAPFNEKCAKYFTLLPKPPKPKNSWDELIREVYGDEVPDFMLDTIVYHDGYDGVGPHIAFSILDDSQKKDLSALRDYLNHYLPPQKDRS
jgi:hypothetical protein